MRKLILALGAVLFVAFTIAERQAHAQAYGAAGCGLGSMVFGNKPGIIQVFAATTNGTFGSQTFGITTGTSNCGASELPGTANAKKFVETNRVAVAKDISRGQGETIKSLAAIGGCRDAAAVGGSLQRSFRTIFPNAGVSNTDVSRKVVDVLRGDKSLSCTKLASG